MAFLRRAVRGGIALKAAQVIAREARKPENQRRVKELWRRAQERRRQAPGR